MIRSHLAEPYGEAIRHSLTAACTDVYPAAQKEEQLKGTRGRLTAAFCSGADLQTG